MEEHEQTNKIKSVQNGCLKLKDFVKYRQEWHDDIAKYMEIEAAWKLKRHITKHKIESYPKIYYGMFRDLAQASFLIHPIIELLDHYRFIRSHYFFYFRL
jgi:hypothetical protein